MQVVVTILEPIHQSQSCLTLHCTYIERLEGLSGYEMADLVCTHPNLVWYVGTPAKILTPLTQKLGCGDGCGGWILISTMSNHLTYKRWKIGRVEMLWIAWISQYTLNLGAISWKSEDFNFFCLFGSAPPSYNHVGNTISLAKVEIYSHHSFRW